MSQMQLLRLFIGERLSAAAEEIFSAVQRTITEREEEAAGRHGPKQEVHGHNDDTPQVCAHEQKHFECEWSPASCHNNPSVDQDDFGLLVPEPSAIKQEQPWSSPDMEDSDVDTVKVTPTDMTSCIYSDMTELQTPDTGNEDRKPVLVEERAQSSSGYWTLLPDLSVTLNNMGPESDRATLTNYSIDKEPTQSPTGRKQLTKSCKPNSPTPPNKETMSRSRPYCCRFCGEEFSHNSHLVTHTQIHTNDKLFTCEVCGKEFRHGNSVTVHMRIHTEEKPYCCRICGKEFRHVGNLNVHMRIHTGEKPYTCIVCGKKFSRNNLMTKHMAVHTEEMNLNTKSVLRSGLVSMAS
ncbi:zinc finger and SCAN domain-containing protein 22-like [Pseudoliparis swirei]|uniref:zinc finger and SCAN domain-containing protein 22-like n=1 Tax=Pseudoliparis swirei TaxID=2059687 RepID=UPI0024BDAB83|nr:zinc finger and SCAN domain-containing protein 22-like [Pseudoliparis swirei]